MQANPLQGGVNPPHEKKRKQYKEMKNMAWRSDKFVAHDANATSTFAGGANIAGNLTVTGTLTINGAMTFGDASADTLTISGASTFGSTVTVGEDGTGYDVTFYGASSGSKLLWDESEDSLILDNSQLSVGEWSDHVALTASVTRICSVLGEITTDLAGGAWVRSLEARAKITSDQSNSTSIFGARCQLRADTSSAAVELSSVHAYGAWLYYEASDSDNALTISGGYHGAANAKVELDSGHTVSGGYINGIRATSRVGVADMSNADSFSAFYVDKDATMTDWDYALEVTDAISTGVLKVADDGTVCNDTDTGSATDLQFSDFKGYLTVTVGSATRYIPLLESKPSDLS